MQLMASIRGALFAVACGAIAVGCAETNNPADDAGGGQQDGQSGKKDLLSPDTVYPRLSGNVYAPEGSIPVSGALVYLRAPTKPPASIPDEVYCDKCVELPPTTPHGFTGVDGGFMITVPAPGKWLLVVQKGAFRRVREIDIPPEGMTVAKELTTLPRITNRAIGDTIPKMLVISGPWDKIENTLAKLGLGEVDGNGSVKKGRHSFQIAECWLKSPTFPPEIECNPHPPGDILKKYELLKDYQIVFVACGGDADNHTDELDGTFRDKQTKETVIKWIKNGGRLYVTDYRYDLLQQILPDYIKWEGQSSTMGSAELDGSYNAPAIVNDANLDAWLKAQGISNFTLFDSWTIIEKLNKLPTPGPDQKQDYDLEPKAWISGQLSRGVRPMTVSYAYGCGRVMFSTYHTEAKKSGTGLLPQEKVLLYIILEVAVCIEQPKID
jgi:hypothetical protein